MEEKCKSPTQSKKNASNPIKKTFDFYKTIGNLWDSDYLASEKIALYYHTPNKAYLSGPTSPISLSLEESKNSSKTYKEKAFFHKKQSKQRLNLRKLQREYIQHASKQKTSASDFSNLSLTKNTNEYPINLNSWEKLNALPADRLKTVIPPKVIEKDLQAIENIKKKTEKTLKELENSEENKQIIKLQDRLTTIKRHNFYKELEKKTGISKIRENNSNGVFGHQKNYYVSDRTKELSMPRKIKISSIFDRSEFRGLLHADYTDAIGKINFTSVQPKKFQRKIGKSMNDYEVQEAINEIQDFEIKFSSNNNSPKFN